MVTEYKEYLNEYQEEVKDWRNAQTLNFVCFCPVQEKEKYARKLLKKAKQFCKRHENAVLYDCEADCMDGDLLAVTCDITGDTAGLCCHIEKY